MGKETSALEAYDCVCGRKITFHAYHWPHCEMNPINMAVVAKGLGPQSTHAKILSKFTKSELAQIATHGPMNDQRIGKHRGKKPVAR